MNGKNARVENKTRNRNARTAGRTGSKLRPTTRPLATNARSGHKTILMIQANLQRSKVATAELLQLATEKGISIALVQEPYVGNQGILKQNPGTKVIQCTVGRQKPVKAAIIVFGDKVEETRTSSHISSERKGLQKSGNRKSDHSWRHKCVEPLVGKPERRQEGQAYRDFLDEMGFHILNTGSTPTFETYRAIESAVV
ncbi:hypothetical protein EVAR_85914_1 [Eumeta japonica]|uniref:Uncharacterized protein n=2 Tax=Eumeta variegata TaxID=151549 RepID=A0A4C2A568_EUMVA|nr:hypothetical protein EVAR_85914_1 [Eumeta japonica]